MNIKTIIPYSRGIVRNALAFSALALISQTVLAVDYQGSLPGSSSSLSKKTLPIKTNVHYQVGSLVGEPVVNAQIDWKPGTVFGINSPLPEVYRRADPGLDNDAEAKKQFRLYQAKVRLTIKHGNNTYRLDTDAGVPARPGNKRSFNVPGSPAWKDLLRDSSGNPVDAETAKSIMRAGLNVTDASVIDYKVDTSRFEEWWVEKHADRYTQPLKEAVNAKLKALSENFGLPVKDLQKEIAAIDRRYKPRAAIEKLQSILYKLNPQNIPKKYLGVGAERMVRLQNYSMAIRDSERGLEKAMSDLPPMPGSSKLYDNWYQQMEVRLAKNRAQMARLQGRQIEILQAEREAQEAEERERRRKERLAREAEEERAYQKKMAERRRALQEEREASASESYESTGWGGTFSNDSCGTSQRRINGVCMFVDPYTGQPPQYYGGSSGDSSGSSGGLGTNPCRDGSCKTFTWPTDNK